SAEGAEGRQPLCERAQRPLQGRRGARAAQSLSSRSSRGRVLSVRWLALAAALFVSAAAADYPERPVRFVVPQAAGSATDNIARLVAPELARQLGQPVVVDNRPGGALTIGIDAVAKSAADGYTIGMGPVRAVDSTANPARN